MPELGKTRLPEPLVNEENESQATPSTEPVKGRLLTKSHKDLFLVPAWPPNWPFPGEVTHPGQLQHLHLEKVFSGERVAASFIPKGGFENQMRSEKGSGRVTGRSVQTLRQFYNYFHGLKGFGSCLCQGAPGPESPVLLPLPMGRSARVHTQALFRREFAPARV